MARSKAEALKRRAQVMSRAEFSNVTKDVAASGDTAAVDKPPKRHRYKSGTVALREIRKSQNGKDLAKFLIRKAPFARLVREITQGFNPEIRFEKQAIPAIQTAAEEFMIGNLAMAQSIAIYSGRKTVTEVDLLVSSHIRVEPNSSSDPFTESKAICAGRPSVPKVVCKKKKHLTESSASQSKVEVAVTNQ
jgi:histone H3